MISRILAAIPRPARLFLLVAAADTALFSLLRGVFAAVFRADVAALPAGGTAQAFLLGAKFDARLAVFVALPVFVLGGARWLSPFPDKALQSTCAQGGGRRVWGWYLAAVHLALLFVYAVDLGHYAFAASRVNVTILQFLYNLGTSARMIWETYPVLRGAAGLALAAWAVFRLAAALLGRAARWAPAGGTRARRALATAAVALLAAGAVYGKLSWYPLRWSDAYFSTSTFAADLAHNPVLYFAETLRKRPAAYDLAKVRDAAPLVARFLGVADPDPERPAFVRRSAPRAAPARRPNVVIVLLESFSAYKTGAFGNPLDPTPRFDALAREGTLYTRFFTPTWGTARSVWATVTGLPDVETHLTATRNPLIVSQHTILNDFDGYEKLYFLGGSLNWANIRGLLAANIEGLRIFEEGSYAAPRVDVWGISDLDLFAEANRVFSATAQPFVAVVQTSGSHRPYTIPADSRGFASRPVADAEARRHGFVSSGEYNAFRFLDHALGLFADAARREPWFTDTIFLFYGDHGLPGTAPHIPRGDAAADLTHFHVPLLIWGPGLVPGGIRFDTVASEVDVLPTAASLAGVSAVNAGLGRDLLDPAFDGMRFAFTVGDQSSSPKLGLIGPDRVFGMFANGTGRRLIALAGAAAGDDILAREPQTAARMEALCLALYETARYLPFVNAPAAVRAAVR
ncbi:MAG TPA: LTA synthase family protein [Candidatus Methanoperedens sp.]|nr:LTA synthase family protein [Candidatus Methanoperedens sp.]